MPDPGALYIRWSEFLGADGEPVDDNRADPGAARWWRSKSLQILNVNDEFQDDGLAKTEVDQQIRVKVDSKKVATRTWEFRCGPVRGARQGNRTCRAWATI
jgi:hypothetical protein